MSSTHAKPSAYRWGLSLVVGALLTALFPFGTAVAATPASEFHDFSCEANAGVVTWTDDKIDLYWIYRSVDDGASFQWLGKTTGATTLTDRNPVVGAIYQVHYQGLPRIECSTEAEPSGNGLPLFACQAAAGTLTWTDHATSPYWIYRSIDDGASYQWLGRALGATTLEDPNHVDGARYQIHYQGIPRSNCSTTPVPPTPVRPTDDVDLAFGGQFYGAAFSGRQTANASIRRYQNGIRFRADATGEIDAVRYQNRHLTKATVEGRCIEGSSSLWCQCVSAGLTVDDAAARACGWTLGNSYAAGNGGLQTVTIHPDDGTSAHMPNLDVVLASSLPYVPSEYPTNEFLAIPLTVAADLEQGRFYHIVWTNTDMPPSARFQRQSTDTAAEWGSNYGAIGLNGWLYEAAEKNSNPLYRHTATYGRDAREASFSVDPDNLPFYGVRYTNGNWLGDDHGRVYNEVLFGGSARIRQVFTVEGADRLVDGVWTILDRRSGSGDVTLQVTDSGGSRLATATILGESVSSAGRLGAWVYADLSDEVSLREGASYSIEYSTPSGSRLAANSAFPLDYSPYFATSNVNSWGGRARYVDRAHAETSSDAGTSWSTYRSYAGRDLNVLFTISGEIKNVSHSAASVLATPPSS